MAKKTPAKRGKKTSAKKTGAARKKTAAAGSSAITVDEKLARQVIKMRSNGESWVEIRDSLGITRGQINPLRKLMRALDPDSVQASGPRGEGRSRKKGKAEGEKKSSKKKSSKKTSKKKKAGGRKKGQRLNLSNISDSALLQELEECESVTFLSNSIDKSLITSTVDSAQMLENSKKFGRLVRIRSTDGKTFTFAVDWIKEIA